MLTATKHAVRQIFEMEYENYSLSRRTWSLFPEACMSMYSSCEVLPFKSFEEVITTVKNTNADLAMLPVENTTYSRVADIHRILPESGLHIINKVFIRVRINLLGLPGSSLDDIK